jgi:hypothetical protein
LEGSENGVRAVSINMILKQELRNDAVKEEPALMHVAVHETVRAVRIIQAHRA